MNRNFTQAMSVRCSDPEKMEQVIELLRQWDHDQAQADIMGYMGIRVLADRETPDEYLILADFGVVDPDVSAADEAARNNDRPETQETATAHPRAARRRSRLSPLRLAVPHRRLTSSRGYLPNTSSTQSQHASLLTCGASGPQWYCAPFTAVNSTNFRDFARVSPS